MEIDIDRLAIKLADIWLENNSEHTWYTRDFNNPKIFRLNLKYSQIYDVKVDYFKGIISKFVTNDQSTEKDNTEQTVYIGKIK